MCYNYGGKYVGRTRTYIMCKHSSSDVVCLLARRKFTSRLENGARGLIHKALLGVACAYSVHINYCSVVGKQ
jgi:hypothetical protein